jgi:pimeloyl-ACP methyl ester carboxylesterase
MELGLLRLKDGPGDCAIVFIHGILSDGESCWRHPNGTYWPQLVAASDGADRLTIFVYTYQSDVFSRDYNLDDVVADFRQRARTAAVERHQSVVLVGHSMGGIVARRFLVRQQLDAAATSTTSFGLLLVASPSLGSDWGSWLTPIAQFFDHSQADALRFSSNNRWLDELDRDFRDLKESNRLMMHGRELIEDKFIVLRRLGLFPRVVSRLSGARYLGEALTIAGSDHFSIAKPENRDALQHVVLLELISTVVPGRLPGTTSKSPPPQRRTELPSGVYFDPETQLMWATADNGSDIGWNEAKEYARQLSLGGYTDWRLPTIEEQEDLYDAVREGAYRIRRPFSLTGALIWSSTKQAPGSGWFFSFENGVHLHNIYGMGKNRCLCVRSAT